MPLFNQPDFTQQRSDAFDFDAQARATFTGTGTDFNRTGREDEAIKAKEAELLQKAKQLENEML